MTPEAQRIAIAEACGMKWCRIGPEAQPYRMLCHWNPIYAPSDGTEPICGHPYMWLHGQVPDYLSDLNAMAEAEKILTDEIHERTAYYGNLACVVHGITQPLQKFHWPADGYACAFASAKQRAEAFLRTLGKWEDAA